MNMPVSHSLHIRPGGLRALLLPDHNDRLELMLDDLLLERQVSDGKGALPVWRRFAREFAAHLESEERWLLPAFAATHPAEGAAVEALHAELRALVAQVERETALDARAISGLVTLEKRLRIHARLEDRHLHQWAVENLDPESWNAVRAGMRALMFDVSPNNQEEES